MLTTARKGREMRQDMMETDCHYTSTSLLLFFVFEVVSLTMACAIFVDGVGINVFLKEFLRFTSLDFLFLSYSKVITVFFILICLFGDLY